MMQIPLETGLATALHIPPAVSVVITVLNMEDTIAGCIESILSTKYPRDAFEVVVVDGGSKDSTLAKLSAFQDVKILHDVGGTIGSGRNTGIRQAKGQVIAITDGDVRVDRDWLSEMSRGLADPTVGAVGGPIFTDPQSPKFSQLVGLLPEESLSGVRAGKVRHDVIYTRNAGYRRTVLEKVGLFDESLVAAEDPELNWRIENAGYDLLFLPQMRVYHFHRESLDSFVRQHFRNGVGCGQLAKINPEIRHTKLRLLSATSLPLGVCMLIAYILSGINALLYLLMAMVLAYVLYCVGHTAPVYQQTRSASNLLIAVLLTMLWLPFWTLGILRGLTKSTRSSTQ